jgi:hypothetical protein
VKNTNRVVSSLLLVTLCIGVAGRVAAQAQDAPDFTGTWKLNMDKSKFRKGTTLEPETLVIKFTGLTIEMLSITASQKHLQTYTADARPKRIPAGPTGEMLTTTQWKDRALIISVHLSADLPGLGKQDLGSSKDRWRMSDDGKTLIDEHLGTKHFDVYDKTSP